MNDAIRDGRYALRELRKTPVFTLTIIGTLSLASCASLLAFGIAKTILWQPLPVPKPGEIVAIYNRDRNGLGDYTGLAYQEFTYLHQQDGVFSGLAAYLRVPFYLRVADQTERVIGELVTSDFFSVLPIRTLIGRTLQSPDRNNRTGAEVLLSAELWRNVFASDPNVLGRSLELNRYFFTIVGVADPEFRGVLMDWQEPPQLWVDMGRMAETLPIHRNLLTEWRAHSMMSVARLASGVNADLATNKLRTIDLRMSTDHPERLQAWKGEYPFALSVLPIQRARFFPGYRESIVRSIGAVAGLAVMILVIACLNISGLMLTRGMTRAKDLAIRTALGATRLRLCLQSFIESTIPTGLGCVMGLVAALWTWRILAVYGRPFRVALPPDMRVDVSMLALMVALTVLPSLLFTIWPARLTAGMELNPILKEGSHRYPTTRHFGSRSVLIGLQVAFSVVLLVGAALFIRTVRNATEVDRRIDRAQLALVRFDLATSNYESARMTRFFDELLSRVRSMPGIERASYASKPPLSVIRSTDAVTLTRADGGSTVMSADFNLVSDDYFDTLGIPILRGRDFTATDKSNSPAVAIVNETMAKKFWPGVDPLGQRFKSRQNVLTEVVGIVADTRTRGIRSSIEPAFYRAVSQLNYGELTLHIRAPNPRALFAAIRETVHELDPGVPIIDAITLQEYVATLLSQERLMANVCLILGMVAVGLSVLGLYGAVTFSVQLRRKEIGIRMAIGAQSRDVIWLVFNEYFAIVVAGVLLGIASAVWINRLAESMLYGVKPTEGSSLAAGALFVTVCAVLAVLIPARRMAHTSPVQVLKHE